jgi:ribonuclease HII
MQAESDHYPWWWFDDNKGYPCPRHKAVLRGLGPSAIHRRSWVFMEGLPYAGVTRFVRPDPQGTLFDCDGQVTVPASIDPEDLAE